MIKEYIDREEAITAIGKPKVTPGGSIFDALKKACQEEVRNLPAADVVEVVRCRECKHYNAGFECLIEGYGIERPADYFCADGERMDGGQDK